MRKVSAVGLVIGVLFLAVFFGIASIPAEMLESNSIEKSDGPIITVPKVPPIAEPETPQVAEPIVSETNVPIVTELQNPPESEPETPQVAEPETQSEDTETNVIRVVVSDGVGTVDR